MLSIDDEDKLSNRELIRQLLRGVRKHHDPVFTMIITVIISLVTDSISSLSNILYYCLPIPAVSFAALNQSVGKAHPTYFLLASSVFTFLSLLIPFLRAWPLYKKMDAGNKPLKEKLQFKVDRLLR